MARASWSQTAAATLRASTRSVALFPFPVARAQYNGQGQMPCECWKATGVCPSVALTYTTVHQRYLTVCAWSSQLHNKIWSAYRLLLPREYLSHNTTYFPMSVRTFGSMLCRGSNIRVEVIGGTRTPNFFYACSGPRVRIWVRVRVYVRVRVRVKVWVRG